MSRRHLSRQPFGAPACVRCPARGHDIGSLLRHARDLVPRPVALCTPDRIVEPARSTARRSAMAVEESPPFRARPRRGAQCPCGASTAQPRDCGEARPAPSGAPTDARRFVRRRPTGGASDCGALYHVHHYARITRVFSRTLAATGLEADLAPRHYRIAATAYLLPQRGCDVLRRRRVVTGRAPHLRTIQTSRRLQADRTQTDRGVARPRRPSLCQRGSVTSRVLGRPPSTAGLGDPYSRNISDVPDTALLQLRPGNTPGDTIQPSFSMNGPSHLQLHPGNTPGDTVQTCGCCT